MATEPRWVRSPQTAINIPISNVTEMVSLRLEDAERYYAETRDELDAAKRVLELRLTVHEMAQEQRDYWKRILTTIKEYDE